MTSRDDLNRMPGHLIRRLNQRSTAVFSERLKSAPVELTSVQYAALDVLAREPGIDQAAYDHLHRRYHGLYPALRGWW